MLNAMHLIPLDDIGMILDDWGSSAPTRSKQCHANFTLRIPPYLQRLRLLSDLLRLALETLRGDRHAPRFITDVSLFCVIVKNECV